MEKKFIFGVGMGIIAGGLVYSIITPIVSAKTTDFYNENKTRYLEKTITNSYNSYIPADKIDEKQLVEGIYKGFVYGTEDAYTAYLDKEEYNKTTVMNAGDYIGTGIKFAWGLSKQYLIVTDVIEGSPAEAANIKVGDKIVGIDNIRAIMSNQVEIADKLTYTGEKAVIYTVQDNAEKNQKDIPLQARKVKVQAITKKQLPNNVGYIKLETMKDGMNSELKEALEALKAKGCNKFILDLRGLYANNLDETQKICDLFSNQGNLFKVEYANKTTKVYEATQGSYSEPIAILTDNFTTGTIEAFVGAMKGQNRATVIGETTGAKGTVEEIISLKDGTGLMITTGKLYTAEGDGIKDKGIEPDIAIKTPMADTLQILTKGSLPLEKDTQLQKAIERLK
ncbi:MAG: S41 family peptidase [Cellulosilyticaceae bacterium]